MNRTVFAIIFCFFSFSYNIDAQSLLADIGDHWACPTIEQAVSIGYVEGYLDGTFKPDQKVTRAEFLSMLLKGLHIPVLSNKEDINWYDSVVNSATDLGLYREADFKTGGWGQAITRFEMARIVTRSLDPTLSSEEMLHKDALYLVEALKKGILQGLEKGKLAQDEASTRAQAVTVIQRVLLLNKGETLEVDAKALQMAEEAVKTTDKK